MDSGYVDTEVLHISRNYRFRLRQLLRAAGYDDAHLEGGLRDLSLFIAESDLFYPEDIASEFVEWHARKTGESRPQAHHAIAEIIRAGFFNDAGVESYAAPCAPMVLGLAEATIQAQASRTDTRFVLGSTDICNLTGLNKAIPERKKTGPFLAHMIHEPRIAIERWAEEHHYRVDTMIIRAGGDEFKYVHRFRTLDGSAIDDDVFKTDIAKLQQHIMQKNRDFSRVSGVDAIPHHKFKSRDRRRAPGVMNTMALRVLAPNNPDIQHTLVELGGDIALIRELMDMHLSAPEPISDDFSRKLPKSMPRANHALAAINPYDEPTIEAGANESLEHYFLRLALEKAGFHDLATVPDLFVYNPTGRWSTLNPEHPAFTALDSDAQSQVRRVVDAEHMRGVIDPISRNYSTAFYKSCRDLAIHQGRTMGFIVHLRNLSGMNLLGDTLGDAVLREVGGIIDKAHAETITAGRTDQKPMVARRGGGEFTVFLDAGTDERAVSAFGDKIREGIEKLNNTTIDTFAASHNVGGAITRNGYERIKDVIYPIDAAWGANKGLYVDFEGKNYEKVTGTWASKASETKADIVRT